jgi:asparagine synthase (glutamine-hydrolysing)
MCGIAGGVWSSDTSGLSLEMLRRMTDALVHRGPDDEGHWLSDPHRRLETVDQQC